VEDQTNPQKPKIATLPFAEFLFSFSLFSLIFLSFSFFFSLSLLSLSFSLSSQLSTVGMFSASPTPSSILFFWCRSLSHSLFSLSLSHTLVLFRQWFTCFSYINIFEKTITRISYISYIISFQYLISYLLKIVDSKKLYIFSIFSLHFIVTLPNNKIKSAKYKNIILPLLDHSYLILDYSFWFIYICVTFLCEFEWFINSNEALGRFVFPNVPIKYIK